MRNRIHALDLLPSTEPRWLRHCKYISPLSMEVLCLDVPCLFNTFHVFFMIYDIPPPRNKHCHEMYPEPRGKSLNAVNINQNQDSWKKYSTKNVRYKRSRIKWKVSCQPPEKQNKAGKKQAEKQEPDTNVIFHNL